MPENEKKGITVKIDAELHAQVKEFIEANGMTMAEFVSKALDDELHPKMTQEVNYVGQMRTMAVQVPEELFQQIKDYLSRHNMTQNEDEDEELNDDESEDEDLDDGEENEDEDESESEDESMSLGM